MAALVLPSANRDPEVFDEPGDVRPRPRARTRIWRSATARTSAPARRWREPSCGSRSRSCSRGTVVVRARRGARDARLAGLRARDAAARLRAGLNAAEPRPARRPARSRVSKPAARRDPLDVCGDLLVAVPRRSGTGRPRSSIQHGTKPASTPPSLDPAVGDHRVPALGVEGIERHRRVGLEAEELPPPLRPGGQLVGACAARRQGMRDGDEVAEPVEDRLAAVELDAAEDVRVVADHDVGAAVDRRPARARARRRAPSTGTCPIPLWKATTTTSTDVAQREDVRPERVEALGRDERVDPRAARRGPRGRARSA